MQWTAHLQATESEVRLLVQSREAGDLLKARLPLRPSHPRALLTLLEGIALWSGERLTCVIAAEPDYPLWLDSGLFGNELWPAESQLVSYQVALRGPRKRLSGVGDFRELRAARAKAGR
jgi:hypothetical protein